METLCEICGFGVMTKRKVVIPYRRFEKTCRSHYHYKLPNNPEER